MVTSRKPSTEIVKVDDANWEVRKTDNDEALGTFKNEFFAELFLDSIRELTQETAPQQIAA